MNNDKNKVVQQYSLEEMKQLWPDRSQIWLARHKVLKKCFTLKRVKYSCLVDNKHNSEEQNLGGSEDEYQKLMRITNDLKRLNLGCAPKCHKMIKTNSHLYVVYDEFPKSTLSACLKQNKLSMLEKWQIMKELVEAVKDVHSKNYVIMGLHPENIYIKENQQVMIADWRLAKNIAKNEVIQQATIQFQSDYISDQVRQLRIYGYWSDVYSLGKIFQNVDNSGAFENNLVMKKKFKEIIQKMLSKDVQERPTIQFVLNFLSAKKDEQKTERTLKAAKSFDIEASSSILTKPTIKEKQVLNNKEKEVISNRVLERNNTQTGILQKYSTLNLQIPSPTSLKLKTEHAASELSSPLRKNSNKMSHALSTLRISKNSEKSSNRDTDNYYMEACRQRNLAFLLLDLSEFVIRMEICPNLAYLLLKQSLVILKTAIQEQIGMNNRNYENQKLVSLLKQEYMHINESIMLLKDSLLPQSSKDQNMRRELTEEKINEQFFTDKVIEFARGIVIQCEKKTGGGAYSSKLSEVLFKTYLILKKVEEGSYSRFWAKVCHREYIFLSHQKYLKEEKCLGYRYLKSKIAQILSKRR